MVLKFTVQNYRSIKQKLEIDFIGADRLRAEREPDAGIRSAEWNARVLPAIAFFGQNGAGKSTIVQALFDFLMLVLVGSAETTDSIPLNLAEIIRPFALDPDTASSPTEFGITILVGSSVFEYSITLKGSAILAEKLAQHHPGTDRITTLFLRKFGANKNEPWEIAGILEPHKTALVALSSSLKDSALFLTLVLKTIEDPQVNALLTAFSNFAFPFSPRFANYHRKEVLKRIRTDSKFAEDVRRLLCLMDIGIESFEARGDELFFHHRSSSGSSVALPFDHESDGTHQLTILSGILLKALREGQFLIIDELDAHLHPLITHQIISLFQTPKVNEKNAQLVFTTHDTTLLDQDLLRRDQIYFVNRKGNEGTTVDSLESYHVRKDLALQRAYLEGRLSGLPTLRYVEEVQEGIKQLVAGTGNS